MSYIDEATNPTASFLKLILASIGTCFVRILFRVSLRPWTLELLVRSPHKRISDQAPSRGSSLRVIGRVQFERTLPRVLVDCSGNIIEHRDYRSNSTGRAVYNVRFVTRNASGYRTTNVVSDTSRDRFHSSTAATSLPPRAPARRTPPSLVPGRHIFHRRTGRQPWTSGARGDTRARTHGAIIYASCRIHTRARRT